uniref:Uncharacterized protein n=1 Tax=Hyaloperonospora arabidopsidis (strain Emoy2) TaxID=559515 RepID=M4BZ74_HYAAE
MAHRSKDGRQSIGSGNESAYRQEEFDGLQDKVAQQKMEIARLLNTVKTLSSENSKLVNDDRIAKYDKWYQTLKAGAKAKQLSQSRESSNGASSFSSSNSFVQSGGRSLSGSSGSYTNGSNFRGHSPGQLEFAGSSSSSTPHQFSRPPAHPNRRAL